MAHLHGPLCLPVKGLGGPRCLKTCCDIARCDGALAGNSVSLFPVSVASGVAFNFGSISQRARQYGRA
jgi:hypothetical protein